MNVPVRAGERTYYPHVEGLRGVAALYVFLYHFWQTAISHPGGTLGAWLAFTPFLQYGHFAVAVFIVISGYCLALPVAQRPERAFDVKRFFVRRARRLMPAYVAVVVLSAIPFAITGTLIGHHVNLPHIALAIGLHLALVHNLFFATSEYLNGPLWSIALECQIYLVFALLLIPVWKRFGLGAQLALAVGLGLVPHFVLHTLDWTAPWLLGLFGLGVVAAGVASRPRGALPWNWIALGAGVLGLVAIVLCPEGTADGAFWAPDLLVGAAVAVFFVAAAHDPRIVPARALALRPVVLLGTFSYSLYLVHEPPVALLGAILNRAHAGPALSAVAWALLIAAVIALAYAFYRVLERPFMSREFRAAMAIETGAPRAATSDPEADADLVRAGRIARAAS
jgi:peptidoglycan/LPS O-acetylase OafA/YrhL